MKVKNIPTPSKNELEKYLKKWDLLEKYVSQEKSLNRLFLKIYPKNNDIEEVLIKCSALNDFYSTNIFATFSVAKHILNLNIDERVKNGDPSLIDDIANVIIDEKQKNFYSFATKYCSHHCPESYPIYDGYVEKVLAYFKNKNSFTKIKRVDFKNYIKFKEVIADFQKFYGLQDYSLKDIDKYLWQLGKEYFPKKFKKDLKG